MNFKKVKREPLDKELEKGIKDEFRGQVLGVGKLIGRDLNHWV